MTPAKKVKFIAKARKIFLRYASASADWSCLSCPADSQGNLLQPEEASKFKNSATHLVALMIYSGIDAAGMLKNIHSEDQKFSAIYFDQGAEQWRWKYCIKLEVVMRCIEKFLDDAMLYEVIITSPQGEHCYGTGSVEPGNNLLFYTSQEQNKELFTREVAESLVKRFNDAGMPATIQIATS